jgi:hypothetical protein
MAEFFTYAVDRRLTPFWLPFGLRPGRDGVTLTDDGNFLARFGFLRGRLIPYGVGLSLRDEVVTLASRSFAVRRAIDVGRDQSATISHRPVR